jgi:pyrophosphatase PpaX
MPAPRPILFDLDGTLANTIPLLLASLRASYAIVGGDPPDEALWLQSLGRPLRSQLADWEGGDAARIEALATTYRDWQRANLERLVTPYDGMATLIAELQARGHALAVVTGKGTQMARDTLALVNLLSPFALVIGAEATVRHKPDPDPLLHAVERLDIDPARTLYIGDAPNDIRAARAAGMVDVWAGWGPFTLDTLGDAVPSHAAMTPLDVLSVLEQLDVVAA